jgi:predicted phage tail protein
MIRTIHLHGAAALQFGGPFLLDVASPAEAVRALIRMKPGFHKFLENADWKVIRGPKDTGAESDIDEVKMTFGKVAELHMIPYPIGFKAGGAGKIIIGAIIAIAAVVLSPFTGGASLGVAMAATAAFGVTYGSIAMFGISMILAGMASMLSAHPKGGNSASREAPDQKPSFLFNGPVNVTQEGEPIPLVFARKIRVGSVVGSAGIFTEEIAV